MAKANLCSGATGGLPPGQAIDLGTLDVPLLKKLRDVQTALRIPGKVVDQMWKQLAADTTLLRLGRPPRTIEQIAKLVLEEMQGFHDDV